MSLERLLAPDTYRTIRIQIRGDDRDMPAYHLDGGVVWGMTERVITSLLAHLR